MVGWPPTAPTRSSSARARPTARCWPPRSGVPRRPEPTKGCPEMWLAGGVDADSRLDAEAAKHLLRRTFRMLRPYRRQMVVAGAMVVLWTATTLAGPFLVRRGIDVGIKR